MKKHEVSKQTSKALPKENAANVKPHNVLEAFESIAELAEGSKLNEEFWQKAAPHIRYASKRLNLSDKQVLLLALFVEHSNRGRIQLSDLAHFTGCRMTKFISMTNDLCLLEQLHYIRVRRRNDELYRIPPEALYALRKNKPYLHEQISVTDTLSFFNQFNRLMEEREDDELTYEELQSEVIDLLKQIRHSSFAQALRQELYDEDDILLFVFMAHLFIENSDDNIGFHDIDKLYDDDDIADLNKRALRNQTSALFEGNFIENINEDGMVCPNRFKLTDKAKYEVLSELNFRKIGIAEKCLIQHDTLAEKQLVYNASEQKQIADLTAILSQERFNDVQERLRSAGMRPGFCCLFYGVPGTGKTETVYQLARQTGRNILRVDVDKIKSCWVGESEKNIKALFDRYRNLCQNTTLAPILLFNEADAVLGVRQEGASKAVDKMENSLQNIILQEMETLEGIMIATTNLTANLDKAFERRFLYKIKYERPTNEARAQIWQTMLPGLNAEDALTLSTTFDLSGGEIENIVRKHTVNAILSGHDGVDLPLLMENCRLERLDNPNRASIGFRK